ncbi:MAG TPA: transcription antitermination factor NusB [Sedimentisphaerales bacterium]|nr:transcription antitermination factor NusB [Sedimentisphaerales bacterium]
MDRRTRARELAMQGLFQLDVQGSELLSRLFSFFIESDGDDMVRDLAMKWTKETWDNVIRCDELIIGSTLKWKMSRLSPVDKSILRLSVYQFLFCDDIPKKVIINEAIELAKKYSTDKSPGFINGVLDAVKKKLKSADE